MFSLGKKKTAQNFESDHIHNIEAGSEESQYSLEFPNRLNEHLFYCEVVYLSLSVLKNISHSKPFM